MNLFTLIQSAIWHDSNTRLASVWLAVCLALVMGFAPLMQGQHPDSLAELACEASGETVQLAGLDLANEPNSGPTNAGEHPDHDNHAHHCGSCHIHLTGMRLAGLTNGDLSGKILRLGSDAFAPRAGPLGLYRPPRA